MKNSRVECTASQGMKGWSGKVAVVTGASAGIGAQITKTLLGHGFKVAGLARRVEHIQELAVHAKNGGELLPIGCDVTKSEEIENAFQTIEKTFGVVHVLINNAGIALELSFTSVSNEEIENLFHVNVIAPIITIRETLKIMEKNKIEGHIIIISSDLGVVSPPPCRELSMYSASKHAIQELSRGLRMEMVEKQTRIHVSTICPGMVDTGLLKKLRIYKSLPESSKLNILHPEDIAEVVLKILTQPAHTTIQDLVITSSGAY